QRPLSRQDVAWRRRYSWGLARAQVEVLMQRLSRDHHIYVLDPAATPAITIDSGEELIVETWDAFEGVRDPALIEERTLRGPASGPIHVRGAEPGDSLRLDLIDITPWGDAVHMVRPGRGFLEEEFTDPYPTIIPIEDGHVVVGKLRLPMAPSMGFVATTPTYVQNTASDSGPYGGDFDMKELVAGSTLFLPVFVPGGMLALGDCHAVGGDGAVAGTGRGLRPFPMIGSRVEKATASRP